MSTTRQRILTSSSDMSSIISSNCGPFTLQPLKTMLLNCSGVFSVLADINNIFVILVLCGIWAESDKCKILIIIFKVPMK